MTHTPRYVVNEMLEAEMDFDRMTLQGEYIWIGFLLILHVGMFRLLAWMLTAYTTLL